MLPNSKDSDIFRALLEFDRTVGDCGGGNSHELYDSVFRLVCHLGPTDAFYVCRYSEAAGTLTFCFNWDAGTYDYPVTIPLGSGPTSWVVEHRQPFILNEANEGVQHGGIPFGDTERQSRTAVHVPIRRPCAEEDEPVLGVLSAQSYQADAYSEEAVQWLQRLADRLGVRFHLEEAAARLAAVQRQNLQLTETFVQMLRQMAGEADRARRRTDASAGELREAIEQLCRTCYRLQTEVTQLPLLPDGSPSHGRQPEDALPNPLRMLTERQREVLRELASGSTDAAIASKLSISPHTVNFHCRKIFEKLGVDNRVQAAQKAAPHLGELEPY